MKYYSFKINGYSNNAFEIQNHAYKANTLLEAMEMGLRGTGLHCAEAWKGETTLSYRDLKSK